MKRAKSKHFWSLLPKLRWSVLNIFGVKRGKCTLPLQKDAGLEKEGLGINAKKIILADTAKIQKTKDFIWEHLSPYSKQIAIMEATTQVLVDNKLEIEEIHLATSYKR